MRSKVLTQQLPNHALQRTAAARRGCNRRTSWPPSLSLSRWMELVIREATPFDYENLCELFDEADKLHRDQLSERFQEPKGPARHKAFILGLLADQTVEVFVVERDGKLLGLVQVAAKDAPPTSIFVPRCYVVVDTLVVKKGFRQQGIGQKLMDKGHHWAKSKGASNL